MDFLIKDVSQGNTTLERSPVSGSGQQKETKEEAAGQKEISYEAVSSQGDTLSISDAGKAVSSGENALAGSDGIVIRKSTTEAAAAESTNLTVNLSVYTETELKQMYLDGEITRAEYEEELSSREAEVN